MVSREEAYRDLNDSDNHSHRTSATNAMRNDRSHREDHYDNPSRRHEREPPRRYYQPTLRGERTPSPPREYTYGVRRQREWSDAYPEEDDYDRRRPNAYPEDDDYYYHQDRQERYHDDHHSHHTRRGRGADQDYDRRPSPRASDFGFIDKDEEEEFRRRFEREQQERLWREHEEERRKKQEAEERYRRWEAEELRRYEQEKELRRYEEENRRRQELRRRQAEEQEREKRPLVAAHRTHPSINDEIRPSAIPKPPPVHPGFEGTHDPSLWALSGRRVPSNKSIQSDDEKTIKISSNHQASRQSKAADSWKAPYPYYQSSSSEHSDDRTVKPLHMCKSDKNGYNRGFCVERLEPPTALKKEGSDSGSSSKSKEKEGYQAPENRFYYEKLEPPAALKRDSSSSRSGSNTNKSGVRSRNSGHSAQPTRKTLSVEIQPGFSLPLRGSDETLEAVKRGQVLETPCMACCCWIVVSNDCDFVICPECRVVSPVENGAGTMQYVGLGMSVSAHDATLARLCR